MRSIQVNQVVAILALMAATSLVSPSPSYGQAPTPPTAAEANSEQAARREILDSARWRRTQRDFDDWLSTQRLYTADEVAAIRARMAADVARMSPQELEAFMLDMEERLDVLMSREAADARNWVSQFLATARNAEQQIREKRPDVMNLSASEIRMELQRFQARRASNLQVQSAFDRGRSQQVGAAQQAQASAQQAQTQALESRSRAAAAAQASRSATPNPRDLPNYTDPSVIHDSPTYYTISPWGTPMRWNAFANPNR